MTSITMRQMLYFDALARTLHFGRAAELAGVTQPALSVQIAQMEDRLGCALFERRGRSVRLTPEAELIRPRVVAVLAQTREIESLPGRGRRTMQGRFRLGIIPTIAPYMLPHVLPDMRFRFPELRLELREAVTGDLVEEAVAGRLDAIVAALPLEHPGLETAALFDDRFFLAVPVDDPDFVSPPVAPDSPALERLMLLEEGHCLREQALAVCGSVKPVAMASYGATSLTTLLHMVNHGLGVTLIPEMAAAMESERSGMKLVPFAEPMPARTVCLAWRRNSSRQGDCTEIAAALKQLAGKLSNPSDTSRAPNPAS